MVSAHDQRVQEVARLLCGVNEWGIAGEDDLVVRDIPMTTKSGAYLFNRGYAVPLWTLYVRMAEAIIKYMDEKAREQG